VPFGPSVSLIVCSKDRAGKIARCLRAIVQIAAKDNFEFILVDNGSRDETKAAFDRVTKFAPFPVRYVFEPTPGVGNAMNAGYRKSHGDIVAFTDDDCYPAPDFAAAVADAFADPAIGVATGRILLHDPMDLALTIEMSSVQRRFRTGRYVRPGQFTGANLSFRRAALEAIGGFDPLFGPGSYIGSAADCDAAARVCLAGWDGIYDPSIVVSHHHGRTEADRAPMMRRYALGSGGYHMKLLIHERQLGHFLHYLGGVPKRTLRQPLSLYWEAVGAIRYIRYISAAGSVPVRNVAPGISTASGDRSAKH
jgi:glycosyltransferase involved in cell wall biosynthesis